MKFLRLLLHPGSSAFGTSLGLLFLRVCVGAMMLFGHGWSKVEGFSGLSGKFPDPIGIGSSLSLVLAIGAEVVCSALLIVGLATRFAVIPLAITMLVAVFIINGDHGWQKQELGTFFLVAYLSLFFTGPGKFSIDKRISGRR